MVIGVLILIGLVYGKELLLQSPVDYGTLNERFELRCMAYEIKTNAIRWKLNKDNIAVVTKAGCIASPGSDTRFIYACEDDGYLLEIPGENMTQDLNNSFWQCTTLTGESGESIANRTLLVIAPQENIPAATITTRVSHEKITYDLTELTTIATDGNPEKENSGTKTVPFVSGKELTLVVSATGSVVLLITAIVIVKIISKYRNAERSEDTGGKLEQNESGPSDYRDSFSNEEFRPSSGEAIENELYASSDFNPGTPCSVGHDGSIDRADAGSSEDEDDHIAIADIFQKKYKDQGGSASDVISITKKTEKEKRPIPVPRRIVTAKSAKQTV